MLGSGKSKPSEKELFREGVTSPPCRFRAYCLSSRSVRALSFFLTWDAQTFNEKGAVCWVLDDNFLLGY